MAAIRRLFWTVWHFTIFIAKHLLVSAAVISAVLLIFPQHFSKALSYLRPIPKMEWKAPGAEVLQGVNARVAQQERDKQKALDELGMGDFRNPQSVESADPKVKALQEEVDYLRHEINRLREREKYLSQQRASSESEPAPACSWRALVFGTR